jgi:hypothetical protein
MAVGILSALAPPLAHAGHFLVAIPFAMPVVLLGGTLAFLVARDRRDRRHSQH